MTIQNGQNVVVAFKKETTFGTAAGATGGKVLRINSGGGLQLQRPTINPNEVRKDGMRPMGRLGSRKVDGSYACDFSKGTFDDLLEGALRGTWAAALVITEASGSPALGGIQTGTHTIIADAGSWLDVGLKVHDVIRLTNHATSANNGRNLRITGLTADTITVAETLTANGVSDTAFTITRPKKLVQADPPDPWAYTIEEHYQDIDASEVYTGCRVTQLQLQMQPDGMVTATFSFIGQDQTTYSGGSAPYFTTPTETSDIALVATDALLRLNGADVANLTGFNLTINLQGSSQPVIGSNITPDVFTANAEVTGEITCLREDLQKVTDFLAETEMSLSVLLVEPESEPKDFVSIVIPRLKLGGVNKSLGNTGAMTETVPIIVGKDETGTGYDATMVKIQTSAA